MKLSFGPGVFLARRGVPVSTLSENSSYTGKNASGKGPAVAGDAMGWNDFFRYRTRLKRLGLNVGIPSVFLFLLSESILLSQPIFDPTMTVFGFDPVIVLALSTLVGVSGSFIAGSSLARFVWKLRNPQVTTRMDTMQKDFYNRISRYRANVPPIPTQPNLNMDFHGEKIKSTADYAVWLRRQIRYKPMKDSLKNNDH